MSNVKLSELPAAVNIDDTDLVYGVVSGQSVSIPAELLLSRAGTLALSATGANVITASTNGVERMRITSAGNVGIATSSPSSALTVQGTITGTAVTQSPTDTTAGRLTKVRDYGWGVPTGSGPTNNPDINTPPASGAYTYTSNPDGFLPSIFGGVLSFRGSPPRYAQIAISTGLPASQMFFRQELDGVNADWNRLYHNNNILGTVSQSSGVPTGAIIQRGSNANGEFVRYADGTQICWCAPFEFDCGATIPQTVELPASFVSRATSKAVGTIIFDVEGTGSSFSDALLAFQNSKVTMDPDTSNRPRLRGTGAANENAIVLVAMFGRWV